MEPFPAWVERLWDVWDTRVLVLLSLTLQIILTAFGSRRKYITGIWIRIVVWSAYLMADWVATVTLGKLSDIGNNDPKHRVLRALWAPLLLLHLGGPDTITAYSMEDNLLWIRHLLGLAVQVGMAMYVIIRCWTNSWLSILSFTMFLAGIIKYGERTWALRSSIKNRVYVTDHLPRDSDVFYRSIVDIPGVKLLLTAFYVFDSLKPHIVNWFHQGWWRFNLWSPFSFSAHTTENVFKITEISLGFMYDVLYTKAAIIYTRAGCILRCISFLSTVSTLLGFSFAAKPSQANIDIGITYVLLVGAVVLEIYSVTLLIYSDWGIVWMIKHHKKPLVTRLLQVLAPRSLRKWGDQSSNISVGQYNLLSSCLNDEPIKFGRILVFFGMDEEFKKYRFMDRVDVREDLKQLILKDMREGGGLRGIHPFPSRGGWAFTRHKCPEDFKWSIQKEFDYCIIIWHIATDICYYSDSEDRRKSIDSRDMSKLLSDYMMYLLVICPSMLSISTGDKNFLDACQSVINMFRGRNDERGKGEACRIFLTKEAPTELGTEILPDAQKLARALVRMEDKWKVVSSVWVDMMCYAAGHCPVNCHAQQLRQAGELLSHVWILLLVRKDTSMLSSVAHPRIVW